MQGARKINELPKTVVKIMLSFTQDKGHCTGCTACKAACPKQCISMVQDEEGFLYPKADMEKCIACGVCEKVCPIQSPIKPTVKQTAYAAVTRDKNIWKRSASGGAFSEICMAWGDESTMIVGAAWDGLNLHHISIIGTEKIAPLCKSKYVASSLEDVFIEIKTHLKSGKKAIFCGTPCQVAGLRSCLRKNYENLLIMDLICHGVGSSAVFKACMKAIGKQLDSEVISYEFRAKMSAFEADYLSSVTICRNQNRKIFLRKDPYIELFLSQKILRPSCGKNCIFRDRQRQGDITIADFKGLTKVFPSLIGQKYNYSTVVSNNSKGDTIIELLKNRMVMLECIIEDIEKFNPLFSRHTWFSNERDSFFQEYNVNSEKAILHHTHQAVIYKSSLLRTIYDLLPVMVRKQVSKLRGIK